MTDLKLDLVDVFANRSLSGNPLAVVRGAHGWDQERMLALTRWLGFSETTFLLPPTDPAADYRVRIFYSAGELPFAGHPTLGSCHAWLAAGGQPCRSGLVVQQCGAGLVEVKQDGDRLAFAAPGLTSQPLSAAERALAASHAGVPDQVIVEAVRLTCGITWQLLRLQSAADVLAATPAARAPVGTDIGLAAPADAEGIDWELRALFANHVGAVVEDPVTGSFNAGLAQHLFASGLAVGSYVAAQGQRTGADGRVHCSQGTDGRVWIGGRCTMVARGATLDQIG